MYEYHAVILDAHDGDTVHASLDLGCDVTIRVTLRLAGINAPELATDAGPPARDHLRALLGGVFPSSTVTVRTVKDRREKYGRYLATILLADGTDVNDRMIADGYAVAYSGGAR